MRLPLALLVLGSTVAHAQPKAPTPAAPAVTGTISGTVKVTENGKPVPAASVVVYVVGPSFTADPKDIKQARIEQKNRTFIPDLVAITKGDSVVFPNKDPGFHNVFSPKPKFDLGTLKPADALKPQTFANPGVVDVYCNIHPRWLRRSSSCEPAPRSDHERHVRSRVCLREPGICSRTCRAMKPVSMKVTIPRVAARSSALLVRGRIGAREQVRRQYTGGKVYRRRRGSRGVGQRLAEANR
jgi:plastocyanin